ncbi:hypothetical protein ACFX13_019921 [Malus domestica]
MVFHSSFINDEGISKACGCPLLRLKSHIKGLAPVSEQDRTDIVDEAISFFHANEVISFYGFHSKAHKGTLMLRARMISSSFI